MIRTMSKRNVSPTNGSMGSAEFEFLEKPESIGAFSDPGPSTSGAIHPSSQGPTNRRNQDIIPPGACSPVVQKSKFQKDTRAGRYLKGFVESKTNELLVQGDQDLGDFLDDILSTPSDYSQEETTSPSPADIHRQLCANFGINYLCPNSNLFNCLIDQAKKGFCFRPRSPVPEPVPEPVIIISKAAGPNARTHFGPEQMEETSPEVLNNFAVKRCIEKYDYADLFKALQAQTSENGLVYEYALGLKTMLSGESLKVFQVYPHSVGTDPSKLSVGLITRDERVVRLLPYHQKCMKHYQAFFTNKFQAKGKNSVISFLKKALYRSTPVRTSIRPNDMLLKVLNTHKCMAFIRPLESSHVEYPPRGEYKKKMKHLLMVPILTSNGDISHVVEICRTYSFNLFDMEMAANYMKWGSMALNFCHTTMIKAKDCRLTDFVLKTVKAIFEQMVSLNDMIQSILQFVQALVDADRASLFLVDYENNELVSEVFDVTSDGHITKKKIEIRIPIDQGIAGFVAKTGNSVNIPDVYSDSRFNRTVDERTGYRTTNILCMPIKYAGRVIAVVQMVNKLNGDEFDLEDERSFNLFSTFFGLALNHAKLYHKINKKKQKYRVALEVLSYHNTCRDSEVDTMKTLKPKVKLEVLCNFHLNPFKQDLLEKCHSVLLMFNDLFKNQNFESDCLIRFILTVKKNYRDVPYHNFDHGWSVAQTMYAILKHDTAGHFNEMRRLALFVAALCHDLDHRGYTNKYMSETASPLAAMYTTSTLEHHHFNITVSILQQEGHNIFTRFSSLEYKRILSYIKHCILATDLAAFFPNYKKLQLEVSNSTFNWKNEEHMKLAMALTMTAADLSASAKPWEVQNETVKVIFEEFYTQGDKERAAGREPIPMMDRNKPDEQPASQVGFLSSICLPCYKELKNILPATSELYEMASTNLYIWDEKAADVEYEKIQMKEINELNVDVSSVSSSDV